MKIKALQAKYIQKSRIFFYPILGIRRGVSVTPVDTFITWKNMYTVNDYKFIVTYHFRDDEDFKKFEEHKLLGNPLFENSFELEDGTYAYVFDMSTYKKEYKLIINGKYSKLDVAYKRKILLFFRNHHVHHAMIESYLYPKMYFKDYAKLLNIDKSILKKVGELCSLPDLNQEMLIFSKKVINFESVNNL